MSRTRRAALVDLEHRIRFANCNREGCERLAWASGMIACREHWDELPRALRDEIAGSWLAMQRGSRRRRVQQRHRHTQALRRAIITWRLAA